MQTHTYILAVKHWIQKNQCNVQATEYPEIVLLELLAAVIAKKAKGWFVYLRYNVISWYNLAGL